MDTFGFCIQEVSKISSVIHKRVEVDVPCLLNVSPNRFFYPGDVGFMWDLYTQSMASKKFWPVSL